MQKLPFNWVDAIIIIVLIFGIFRGKMRGMSNELLDVLQWLMIVVLGALYYEHVGQLIVNLVGNPLFANVISYVLIGLGIKIAFIIVKRMVGEKLVGSDLFGRAEFLLGMVAGMVRYGCIVLAVMAIAHAPYVSRLTVEESQKKQEAEFGSAFFPTFAQIQYDMFFNSILGHLVKNNLENQLISPVAHYTPKPQRPTASQKREQEVEEAISGRKKQ